mmetsp:Transcript_5891/g.9131  ORF Transcript_5891/g.9131 Transcript_5891/m.9131 type:complete len:143 (+) Transcript_5891:103-531(+)
MACCLRENRYSASCGKRYGGCGNGGSDGDGGESGMNDESDEGGERESGVNDDECGGDGGGGSGMNDDECGGGDGVESGERENGEDGGLEYRSENRDFETGESGGFDRGLTDVNGHERPSNVADLRWTMTTNPDRGGGLLTLR